MIEEQEKGTRKHYIDNLRNYTILLLLFIPIWLMYYLGNFLLTVLSYHLIKRIPVVRKMFGIR